MEGIDFYSRPTNYGVNGPKRRGNMDKSLIKPSKKVAFYFPVIRLELNDKKSRKYISK